MTGTTPNELDETEYSFREELYKDMDPPFDMKVESSPDEPSLDVVCNEVTVALVRTAFAIDVLDDNDGYEHAARYDEIAEESCSEKVEDLPKTQTTHANLLCLLVLEARGFIEVLLIGPIEFTIVAVTAVGR